MALGHVIDLGPPAIGPRCHQRGGSGVVFPATLRRADSVRSTAPTAVDAGGAFVSRAPARDHARWARQLHSWKPSHWPAPRTQAHRVPPDIVALFGSFAPPKITRYAGCPFLALIWPVNNLAPPARRTAGCNWTTGGKCRSLTQRTLLEAWPCHDGPKPYSASSGPADVASLSGRRPSCLSHGGLE